MAIRIPKAMRYARTFDEMVADWKSVNLPSIKQYHERFISAARGEFAAVGDLDQSAVQQALNTALRIGLRVSQWRE